jgi:hypothetical protein
MSLNPRQPHLFHYYPLLTNQAHLHMANIFFLSHSVTGMKYSSSAHPVSFIANPYTSKTFLARLCEQAERYDEMVTYMKEVAKVRHTGPDGSIAMIDVFLQC